MTTETRLENAISRAIEINGESAARYVGDGRFLIVSAHDSGAYEVTLNSVDGDPNTTCSCKAGEHGFPCWHQATVLLMAGFADEPQVEPTVEMPDPAIGAALLSDPLAALTS